MRQECREPHTDEKGRLVTTLYQDGMELKYYTGLGAQGIIMRDCNGEYIVINGERRYWRGIIDPLPLDPRLEKLKEFSFVVLKPDALARGLYSEILSFLKGEGFKIVVERNILFDSELIYKMYPYFMDQEWECSLIRYLTSGISHCFLLEGKNVVNKLLTIRQRIRELYAKSVLENLIHCSDSREEAIRGALLIFEIDEIVNSVGCER